jgi:pyrroloquinoline quinone (PQQ) biosynthesis protein C
MVIRMRRCLETQGLTQVTARDRETAFVLSLRHNLTLAVDDSHVPSVWISEMVGFVKQAKALIFQSRMIVEKIISPSAAALEPRRGRLYEKAARSPMTVSSKDFVKEIQQMVQGKHSKNHPIIGMIEEGKLTRNQLQGFVGQFYLFFPKPFPKPIAAMLSRCPDDPELEKMWIENVVEEGTGEITGTDSHKGLFIRFAQACGLNKEALDRVQPLPETEAFLDWRELLMYQRSWLELYACQGFCLEGTANERMTRIVNGLTNHYGFNRDSEDIRYWTLHMGVDEEHMKVGPLAVERYAVTEPQQAVVRWSVQKTLDQFWLAFDGIKRAFVDEDPLYARWRKGN